MFILIVSIIQLILFVLHFIVYQTFIYFVVPTLAVSPGFLLGTRIFFLIMSISFVGSSIVVSYTYKQPAKLAYRISAIWLGTMWFVYIVSVVIVFFKFTPIVSGIMFMIAVLISIVSVVNSFSIYVNRIEIKLDYLPEAWKGKKAIMLADSHLGNMRGNKFIGKVTDLILEQKPDIVFIVGDLFDGRIAVYDKLISPLRKLTDKTNIPLGTYFVTGNHEEFDDPTPFLQAVKNTGIKILDNQAENIQGLTIAGVDYKATDEKGNYERILQAMLLGVDKQTPIILLKHIPSNVNVAEKNSVDLCLHGHTHNAQIWPFNYLARRVFKGYEFGLKKFKDMNVYTTSGVGTWGPPQRFFTRSEIVEIKFI